MFGLQSIETEQMKCFLAYSIEDKKRVEIAENIEVMKQREMIIVSKRLVKHLPHNIARAKTNRIRNIKLVEYVDKRLNTFCKCEDDAVCEMRTKYREQILDTIRVVLREQKKPHSKIIEMLNNITENPFNFEPPTTESIKQMDRDITRKADALIRSALAPAMWKFTFKLPLYPVEEIFAKKWIPHLLSHPTSKKIIIAVNSAMNCIKDGSKCRDCLSCLKNKKKYWCNICHIVVFCNKKCKNESMSNQLTGHIVECPLLIKLRWSGTP